MSAPDAPGVTDHPGQSHVLDVSTQANETTGGGPSR